MTRERFVPVLVTMLAGFLVWFGHFGAIYGFTGLVCARPGLAAATVLGLGILPAGIAAATLAAFAALAAVGLRPAVRGAGGPAPAAFARWTTVAAVLLSGLAVLWQALPVLIIPGCA